MDEENNNPRTGVSRSFIFSIFVVLGIIAIVVYFILSRMNGADVLTPYEFVHYLRSGNIENAQVVAGSNFITVNGKYTIKDSTGNEYKNSYRVTFTDYEFNNKFDWGVDVTGDERPDQCNVIEILNYVEKDFDGRKYTPTWACTNEGGCKREWVDSQVETDDTGKHICPYCGQELVSIENPVAKTKPTFVRNETENPYKVGFWDEYGPTIILLGGSAIIMIFLLTRMSSTVNASNKQAMDFNRSRARKANSKVKFSDVAGADEEKAEMQELVYYLKDPRKFTRFGAKLPKGVLLVGPPGCGKTLLAKAVAGEAGVPFFSISGSDFVEMFVGVGAGRVRDMFRIAKENAPCLVFIDEIDAVGRQRGAGLGGGNDEREQTLNQLLVEMDGFNDNSGIIVIAATNRDDVLDPALLRAGRFDRKITVSLPDRKGREEIFKVHSRNKFLDDDVNFENIAKRTVGFSGADIENIMNEAAILAVRANREKISVDDIDEAIDRRVAGPAKSSRSLSEREKEIVAYHEAGHAIIGLRYPHSDKVQKITIIPRGNTGGHVRMTPEEDRFLLTKKELEARIVGYLGGRCSEETFFDDVSSGAQNDIEVATQIARVMVCELGMSSLGPIQYERDTGSVFLGRDYTSTQKNFSVETATKIDAEVRSIIENAHKEATRVIAENKDDVILLAKTLMEHEQITAEEIDYLMEHRHLKRDEKPGEEQPVEEPAAQPAEEPVPEAPKQKRTRKPKAASEPEKPAEEENK